MAAAQVQQQTEWVHLKIQINRKCIHYSLGPSYYPVLHRRQSPESRFCQLCKSWTFLVFICLLSTQKDAAVPHRHSPAMAELPCSKIKWRGFRQRTLNLRLSGRWIAETRVGMILVRAEGGSHAQSFCVWFHSAHHSILWPASGCSIILKFTLFSFKCKYCTE